MRRLFPRFVLFAVSAVLFSNTLMAAPPAPKGFDDKGLIDLLLKGDIDSKDLVNTSKEMKVLYRAYFDQITTADYLEKIEDQDNYRNIFSEIKDSTRLSKYATGRKYQYQITANLSTPVGNMPVKPVIDQEIIEGATASDGASVTDTVTNYSKEIHAAGMTTRMVPYGNGLLVASTVQLHLKGYSFIGSTKADFRKGNLTMVEELRDELNANP